MEELTEWSLRPVPDIVLRRIGFKYAESTIVHMTFQFCFLNGVHRYIIDGSHINDDGSYVVFIFKSIFGEYNCVVAKTTFRPQWHSAVPTETMKKIAYKHLKHYR